MKEKLEIMRERFKKLKLDDVDLYERATEDKMAED
jgi:hypothetical protein